MDKQVSVLPLSGVVWLCGLVVSGGWGCSARDTGSGASAKETGHSVDTASDDTGEDQGGDSGGRDSSPVDTGPFDQDGDGVWAGEDCDDENAMVHPGAEEICEDGLDNDCDGSSGECRWSGWEQLSEVSASVWTGVAAEDWAGHAVAMAGDVNGDGSADFVTSSLHESTVGEEAGAIYLVHGPVSGWRSLGDSDAVLLGSQAGDRAGRWVQGRDLDGDGYSDLVTGAALAESSAGIEAGNVYLVHGPVTGSLSLEQADVELSGEEAKGCLGRGLALAGDVDGDGWEDLLVGANRVGDDVGGNGAAYLFLGPFSGDRSAENADARAYGESGGSLAGSTVAGDGDVDGDGLDDLLVGAYADDNGGEDAGAVYLLRGPVSGTMDLGSVDTRWVGGAAGDGLGRGLAIVGDTDGDGLDDVMLGATQADDAAEDAGAIYLWTGPVASAGVVTEGRATWLGEEQDAYAGESITRAGDVDRDGYLDVLVGAYGQDGDNEASGVAYLLHGPFDGTMDLGSAGVRFDGGSDSSRVGWALAAGSDLDGDGFGDLLVGAYRSDVGLEDAGAVFVVPGRGL